MHADTLVLSDIIAGLRAHCIDTHGLDIVKYVTLAQFSYDLILKDSRAKCEPIGDLEMYKLFRHSLRGGLSDCMQVRHMEANCRCCLNETYNENLPIQHCFVLDVNGLYASCQLRPMPEGNFRWLSDSEIDSMQKELQEGALERLDEDSSTGYLILCDLDYPSALFEKHSNYPCCVERKPVPADRLSKTSRQILDFLGSEHDAKMELLVADYFPKMQYIFSVSAMCCGLLQDIMSC